MKITYERKVNLLDFHRFSVSEPDMSITQHTDDDYWYPKELDRRPIFISLTFYLEGIPKNNKYSRFQIKLNDEWEDIILNDNSVLFMNSDIYIIEF
jgi:hypothetical protein